MKLFFRLVAFLGLVAVFGAVLWCALAPAPDLVRINWMPRWLGKWADANPMFRNFPAFGILAMAFYAAGFAGFDPKRGAGQCALAFVAAAAVSLTALALELSQVRLPGRFFDPDDIAWSIAGAFAAFLASLPRIAKLPAGSTK